MSLKDVMVRIIDAVASAIEATPLERVELERSFIDDPRGFVAEYGDYLPEELLAIFAQRTAENEDA